ncbi:type-F conjugative transfer system protein TraW [Ideonella sp. 4Y16]|uniref:Type-F conjugative transfer system protein TraW n=1 Tax=Ideonella aquatica TaxID=2824119 RepID=A0A940YSQ2_9BURK|nr:MULTISPECIES: type-F conjugative transfer system protein TraW [Ideonella]MBQ0946407.1 type-F conjugative transfer system protein TraW [Ideonella alba]MBQ0961756.1 type-F conjugative transfer system protein TraW [Ideonella aquatica]
MASVWTVSAQARDLGARGPLYEISEPDLLQEMLQVMRAKQASGELQRLQDEAKRRAIARVETPAAVPGLRRTVRARTFLFDPSVRFDEPVVDHQGRIVIAAGTVGNPLQAVRLTRELLFFDGRDPDQVKLVKARLDELGTLIKPILVAGQPLALTRQWKVQVFFDQDGQLVQRFGIRQVPARVSQDGLRLKVEELPL